MSILNATNALGYYTKPQLDEIFLKLDQEHPGLDKTPEEVIKKRVLTTYYGKNISNIVGYVPVLGTIQAVFLKIPLFYYLDAKLVDDVEQAPERRVYFKEVRKFHKWEQARTGVEFLGLGLLLAPADIIATATRK